MAVRREFEEEAGNLAAFPARQRQFRQSVDELFAHGKQVYRVRDRPLSNTPALPKRTPPPLTAAPASLTTPPCEESA